MRNYKWRMGLHLQHKDESCYTSNVENINMWFGTSISPHAKASDFGDALVGLGRPKHQLVLSDNYHGERWQMFKSPNGKGQNKRTYHPRDQLVQRKTITTMVQKEQSRQNFHLENLKGQRKMWPQSTSGSLTWVLRTYGGWTCLRRSRPFSKNLRTFFQRIYPYDIHQSVWGTNARLF